MKLKLHKVESLPRLAWCASIKKDSGNCQVNHGDWVETGKDWFVEGAWNGDFQTSFPDEAQTFVGSAGRCHESDMIFASATDLNTRLFFTEVNNIFYISRLLYIQLSHLSIGSNKR